MKGDLAERIAANLGGQARFAISGYTTTVDWAASALVEFMYLELVLTRGMEPRKAAEQLAVLMPFSGANDLPGAVLKGAGFRLVGPDDAQSEPVKNPASPEASLAPGESK